ncbi:expressed unknown protein [Seminavis robusta]|uniref:CRAL-TRIO domain-containing protein n=1 Tax=Seminavis robusta TaxID=568900 RepID=A0A9N8E5K4_9STRA|nr:expressed unknown protein [Seminavis robusta]|eukprot:Sro695_g188660.1 n/a (282) ;mRNA; r:17419-18264
MCLPSTNAASTSADASGDARYELTESEREAVIALKAACDQAGIAYNNLFELAKYVLVVHSSFLDSDEKAPQKRLEKAVSLMKKRNAWAKKHQLEHIDPMEALEELYQLHPDFFVTNFSHDHEGRVVVAHHHAHAPSDFVYQSKKNGAKYLAAEQFRMNLGAVDMEEARRGMCMVSITDNQLTTKRSFRYLRLVTHAQENLKSMHPNRVRSIYSQVPAFVMYLVPTVKLLLPKKIASRVNIVGNMEELGELLHSAKNPDTTVLEWAEERHAKYLETVKKLIV